MQLQNWLVANLRGRVLEDIRHLVVVIREKSVVFLLKLVRSVQVQVVQSVFGVHLSQDKKVIRICDVGVWHFAHILGQDYAVDQLSIEKVHDEDRVGTQARASDVGPIDAEAAHWSEDVQLEGALACLFKRS